MAASAATSSRPGGMTRQTVAPSPRSPSSSAVRAGSQSPELLDRQLEHVEAPLRRRAARARRAVASVSGEAHTQVLTPICGSPRAARLATARPREAGHLLAAAQGVVQRRHARLQVLRQVLLGDGRLRQDPLARHLLARQDLQRGDDRGAPLERRVRRRDAVRLGLAHFCRKSCWSSPVIGGHVDAGVLERLDRGDGRRRRRPSRRRRSGPRAGGSPTRCSWSLAVSPSVNSTPTTSARCRRRSRWPRPSGVSSTSTPGRMRSARTLPPGSTSSTRNSAASAPNA